MTDPDSPVGRLDEVLDLDRPVVVSPDGYVDIVGDGRRSAPTGIAQRLMESTAVPRVYERWWRPALGRVAKGVRGPSMDEEERAARQLLALAPGMRVVDLACGPGNFSRAFARTVGPDGLVVGVDLSTTMLARAVRDTELDHVCYLRADAADLPYRPGSVDAICCFAALHLFDDPERALDGMHRGLRSGGRLALLTSERPDHPIGGPITRISGRLSGMRIFPPGELTQMLEDRGFEVMSHERFGAVQLVGARVP